jgi:arylsulfatase A-like enzyme
MRSLHTSLASLFFATAVAKAPHVVYFLVDDLGHANVGFNNDEPITPNIDALAKQSVILERYKF